MRPSVPPSQALRPVKGSVWLVGTDAVVAVGSLLVVVAVGAAAGAGLGALDDGVGLEDGVGLA
jgi:hypothetical protein